MRYYIHKDRCFSCIHVIYNIYLCIYIYFLFYIHIIRHFAIHMLYIMAHSSRDTKTQTDRDARRLRLISSNHIIRKITASSSLYNSVTRYQNRLAESIEIKEIDQVDSFDWFAIIRTLICANLKTQARDGRSLSKVHGGET